MSKITGDLLTPAPVIQGISIIRFTGTLDAESAGQFNQLLALALENGLYRLIIDLSKVEFISSAGWGVFTGNLKAVREKGGDIKLVGMQENVSEIFYLLELDHFIDSFSSMEEAEKAFFSTEDVYQGAERLSREDFANQKEETLMETSARPRMESIIGELSYKAESEKEKPTENKKIVFHGPRSSSRYMEQIIRVVQSYPKYGPTRIQRELNSPSFGSIRISRSTIYRMLKEAGLNRVERRIRYFEQLAK